MISDIFGSLRNIAPPLSKEVEFVNYRLLFYLVSILQAKRLKYGPEIIEEKKKISYQNVRLMMDQGTNTMTDLHQRLHLDSIRFSLQHLYPTYDQSIITCNEQHRVN